MPGLRPLIALAISALVATACSSAGTTPAPTAAPTAAPATAATSAGTAAASVAAASSNPDQMAPVTGIEMKAVGALGNVLVASNGYTVYTFTKDVKDSGKSACAGGCLTRWPALTVAPGTTPSAGPGAAGKLGTITRADNSALQVTYNGMPLYFFSGDAKAGDSNGVYPNWEAVKP